MVNIRTRPSNALLALLFMLSGLFVLVSCNPAQSPGQITPVLATATTIINTPTAEPPLPTAVQTYAPIVNPTVAPYASITLVPYTPPPYPTLPPPPPAVSITPVTSPTLLPSLTPATTPTVHASVTSSAKVVEGGSEQTIAWGVETSNTLSIWLGTYSDLPTPSIWDAKQIAHWDTALVLLDMAVSPDGQSLAVLSGNVMSPGTEGIRPRWLSVIDLQSFTVQSVPDYSGDYSLYENYYYRPPQRILGWLDSNRFAVQQIGDDAAVIATKDGTYYSRVSFPPQFSSAVEMALSPDGNTLFSLVAGSATGGFWIYGTDGSNPAQLLDRVSARPLYHPIWSPDGNYISFLSPKREMVEGRQVNNFTVIGVWLLDLATHEQKPMSKEDSWDVAPVWSSDSSKIAFLRADEQPGDADDVWYGQPEKTNSNVFYVDTDDPEPIKITTFTGVKNSNLQWTSEGNLVLSSTAGGTNGLRGLIAVYPNDGDVENLLGGSTGESLVHPLIWSP